MPNHTLREALDAYTNSPDGAEGTLDDQIEERRALELLADAVREFIDANPNFEQALALLRQVKTNANTKGTYTTVVVEPFDLPAGYLLVSEQRGSHQGFTCGIAPDGSVSS